MSKKIPVPYLFTKSLNGFQLPNLNQYGVEKVQQVRFKVIRLNTDNHKVDVGATKDPCGKFLT
ncbi:hypothetical protein HPB48_012875 [Haemaphysalis longicornis]|uniref:Uncharacterized protein n=1 Tax=Haemaphysalis longicornis TaxID=44386 RepID=A0A9J6GH29_HAELO|nr:hypothetical protein HPB48_012875 [Haemaphysalis longicornis]